MILCGGSDSGEYKSPEQDLKYLYWTISKILSANLFTCKGTYMTDWVGRTVCSIHTCMYTQTICTAYMYLYCLQYVLHDCLCTQTVYTYCLCIHTCMYTVVHVCVLSAILLFLHRREQLFKMYTTREATYIHMYTMNLYMYVYIIYMHIYTIILYKLYVYTKFASPVRSSNTLKRNRYTFYIFC